jgi:hypothetical protein
MSTASTKYSFLATNDLLAEMSRHSSQLRDEKLRRWGAEDRDAESCMDSVSESDASTVSSPSKASSASSSRRGSHWWQRRALLYSVSVSFGAVFTLLVCYIGVGFIASTDSWGILPFLPIDEPFPDAAWDFPETTSSGRITYTVVSDPTHIYIPDTPLTPAPSLLTSLSNRLPYNLLTAYYITGLLPTDATPQSVPGTPPIDLVYTYVNASSKYLQDAQLSEAKLEGVMTQGNARRWRDNGELRGAIRSAVSSLGSSIGRIHVVSGDYAAQVDERVEGLLLDSTDEGFRVDAWRVGQIPAWLDWTKIGAKMQWSFHSDVFRLPRDNNGQLPPELVSEGNQGDDEEVWQDAALPNFNSFEIETRLGWTKDLREHL